MFVVRFLLHNSNISPRFDIFLQEKIAKLVFFL
jgi:hypothetical protein